LTVRCGVSGCDFKISNEDDEYDGCEERLAAVDEHQLEEHPEEFEEVEKA